MDLSPTLDIVFNLPNILKILEIVEEKPGITQKRLIETTQMNSAKIEDYRKWALFSGLISRDNELTTFGNYRNQILYECNENLFKEIVHFNLVQNSNLYKYMMLEGYHRFKINERKDFKISQLYEWVENVLSSEKIHYKHFRSTILNQINSLLDSQGLYLRVIKKTEKNLFRFQTYFPTKESIYFAINKIAYNEYNASRSSAFVDPSLLVRGYQSLSNVFITTQENIETILFEFRKKGFLTYEKSADLDQIGILTNYKNQEDIFKTIIGDIFD